MSSKFGRPPQPPKVDPSFILKGTNVTCEKCGNGTFAQVFIMKHISKILSPTGEEGLVPIPIYACNVCNHVNDVFIPEVLRAPREEAPKPSAPPSLIVER